MPRVAESPQDAAERVLKLLWQRGHSELPLPVDPVRIAHLLGIDVFDASLPSDVSAVLEKAEGRDPRILLNVQDSPNRQRFSCAHEIGHFIQRGDTEYEYVDFRNIFSSRGENPEEIYANAFAASLLMPEAEVKRFARQKMPEFEMALRLGVSNDAMRLRLANLGLTGV